MRTCSRFGMDGKEALQLIVIEFGSAVLPPVVHAQIEDYRRRGVLRLVDSVTAVKEDSGNLIVLNTLDAPRGDPAWSGVLTRSFFDTAAPSSGPALDPVVGDTRPGAEPRFGVTEEQLLEIVDLIPTGGRVLILLVEHLWASDLAMAAIEADGHMLANCSISPGLLAQFLQRGRPLLN